MTNEQLRMQMLSGVITEGEYKAKLQENETSENKESLNENFVGMGAINSPFAKREKESYEDAFEHFLSERYQIKPNRERDDIKDLEEDKDPDVYESKEMEEGKEEINENYEPNKMLELIQMYVDNYSDEGMSAEAAIKKIDQLFQGNLDDYDKAFMAGKEDQY